MTEWFDDLSRRLRRVRICCGDWSRVLGPSPTYKCAAPCAVFLDPPYSHDVRGTGIYPHDIAGVSGAVRAWALANGSNPQLWIALCGYEGEHEMPAEWEMAGWRAQGGYGRQGNGRGRTNRHLERIWFSPHTPQPQRLLNMPEED